MVMLRLGCRSSLSCWIMQGAWALPPAAVFHPHQPRWNRLRRLLLTCKLGVGMVWPRTARMKSLCLLLCCRRKLSCMEEPSQGCLRCADCSLHDRLVILVSMHAEWHCVCTKSVKGEIIHAHNFDQCISVQQLYAVQSAVYIQREDGCCCMTFVV